MCFGTGRNELYRRRERPNDTSPARLFAFGARKPQANHNRVGSCPDPIHAVNPHLGGDAQEYPSAELGRRSVRPSTSRRLMPPIHAHDEAIGRTRHTTAPAIEDMRVDHGRPHLSMTRKALHRRMSSASSRDGDASAVADGRAHAGWGPYFGWFARVQRTGASPGAFSRGVCQKRSTVRYSGLRAGVVSIPSRPAVPELLLEGSLGFLRVRARRQDPGGFVFAGAWDQVPGDTRDDSRVDPGGGVVAPLSRARAV
jgi:hypothetical protein